MGGDPKLYLFFRCNCSICAIVAAPSTIMRWRRCCRWWWLLWSRQSISAAEWKNIHTIWEIEICICSVNYRSVCDAAPYLAVLLFRLCDVTVAADVECVVIVEFDSIDEQFCTFCTFWILLKVWLRFWCCVFVGNLEGEYNSKISISVLGWPMISDARWNSMDTIMTLTVWLTS